MVIGLSENTDTKRRVIFVTLLFADLTRAAAEGIHLSAQSNPGFPDDLEVAIGLLENSEALAFLKAVGALNADTKVMAPAAAGSH